LGGRQFLLGQFFSRKFFSGCRIIIRRRFVWGKIAQVRTDPRRIVWEKLSRYSIALEKNCPGRIERKKLPLYAIKKYSNMKF
jgi:hypothetical protein